MSENIISAKDVTKTYRLYTKPHYRFLDVFGLLRGKNKYTEHHALHSINLNIRRGEKVALIGRNGAGKSTLLKLITGVTLPTSGTLVVRSQASALLQIGTTFHPEFTGRENVLSYLSHLGITDDEAKEKLFEILEFSELDEYIDQPVKTYSTGMGARLMFAAATVMQPELLVIDEILSVGDAYFAQKSFERIKEMCASQHTTLLLVSHDVYSASKLCDRMVWIERGAIFADGPSIDVMRAYEESIRLQEERRLDVKRQRMLAKVSSRVEDDVLLGFLKREEPGEGKIWISELRLVKNGQCLARVDATRIADVNGSGIILDEHENSWGEPVTIEGRMARPLLLHGSIFDRYPFAIAQQGLAQFRLDEPFLIEIDYLVSEENNTFIGIYRPSAPAITRGGDLVCSPPGWTTARVEMVRPVNAAYFDTTKQTSMARFGRRDIEIVEVNFHGQDGKLSCQFQVGSKMEVRIAYRVNQENFFECPICMVAFRKDGVEKPIRLVTDQIAIGKEEGGELKVSVAPLLLGVGSYYVTVGIFKEGYFHSAEAKKFYTTNQGVYDIHTRAYEILVLPNEEKPLDNDVIFLHPSNWVKQRLGE